MTNKQNQNHGGENYLNIMSCYYICLCINKLGKVLQIFCYKKTDKCFIMKKKIMVKKGKEDKWLLPKLSFDVHDNGDVVSISCKICKTYIKRQTLVLVLSITDWFNCVTFFSLKLTYI